MLSCPFLHANLSFQFVNYSFVSLFEFSSPSCLESPLRRSMFTELHLTVASWDSWAPFTWIPSENLIITDHQLVTSLLLILPRHVRCQYVSHLGPSTFPLVAKCLVFLTWICFSDAALASTSCMDEFCKRAAAQGGSDQLGGDGNSLSWLCCCWKSILQLLSQKTVDKIK